MADYAVAQDALVGQTLGHYCIAEKIGSGGMGDVYRAHDEHLDREVAIKVLPSGTLSDESSRKRFRKEALTLSKLNHPNIATIHDFDTRQGVDFLVMEYIPGITLSEKVAAGPLPEKDVVCLGMQLAEGLSAAHERGVVHCDLKPGNLRLTRDGRLKILDFGLAKLRLPLTASADTESLSETESMAGTLPYMAPEQLLGEGIDARTDIHAAGAVLYEIVTGQRPFAEVERSQLIGAILRRPPRPATALNPRLSPELDRIVGKCLETDPENRYQSVRELAVDLRRLGMPTATPLAARHKARVTALPLAGVLIVAIAIAVTPYSYLARRSRIVTARQITSVAVLPLANLSGDPNQDYFSDGMTEALITDLSKIKALKVISRTSIMQYKGAKKPLPEIARELGVEGIVEGSVLRSGDRVRITAQLIDAREDRHLWADTYDRDLRDVLLLQSEVAGAVAGEIRAAVTPAERQQLASARPVNPLAYEEVLKGRSNIESLYVNEEEISNAIGHFGQALTIDPNYAPAYVGLADANMALADVRPPKEVMPRALEAVQKALTLDNALPEAHATHGDIKWVFEWDWEGSEHEFRRALQLNPNNAHVLEQYALYMCYILGRFDECLAANQRAIELDPLNWGYKIARGLHYLQARRYEEAIRHLQNLLDVNPITRRIPYLYATLAWNYALSERHAEAAQACDRALGLVKKGDSPDLAATCGWVFGLEGQRDKAKKILANIERMSAKRWVNPYYVGLIYLGLGDHDRAMDSLEKAFAVRGFPNLTIPGLDPLRSNPRFENLFRRMNFPQQNTSPASTS